MTVYQAYEKVRKLPERNVLLRCLDLQDKWMFRFHNEPIKSGEMIIGGGYDVVNKQTGEVSSIPVFMAQDLIKRATELDIKPIALKSKKNK